MLQIRLMPIALASTLALAACVEPVPLPEPIPVEGSCGASSLQGLVGQPASVLATMRFAGPVRIIRPGMAVTMDYSAERLNINIDRFEVIERVSCG